MERGRRAALQHVGQRRLENILDVARPNLVHRLDPELEQGAAIGRQDQAVVVHRQLALVQGVDELRAAVEMQRMRTPKLPVNEPVFDHAGRHAEQHQQMLLHQAGAAGDVEHGDDLSRGLEHRNRRTGQLGQASEKVIFAAYRHRASSRQARAHAVGSGCGFAPDAPGAQAQWFDLGCKLGRRDHLHDHAVGVGQQHGRIVVAELLIKRGHLVTRTVDHIGSQRSARHHRGFTRTVRVQAVVVQAAGP